MPDFIPPQLATLQDKPPDGDQWFNELKFDGYRLLCHLNGKHVRFWTRNKKDWTHKFPRLAKAMRDFPARNAILDGEVVAVDEKGRASFQKLVGPAFKSYNRESRVVTLDLFFTSSI